MAVQTPPNNSMDVEVTTATLFVTLSVKLKRAWRRFRPTSSQALKTFGFVVNINSLAEQNVRRAFSG